MRQPCWMFDVFAQTKSGFYVFIYIQTGHSIYIYYLLYNYLQLYTHSNHSNTQRQRRKVRGGGLNRTQKTPLDKDQIFRSIWCFYHGWHESFYFDENENISNESRPNRKHRWNLRCDKTNAPSKGPLHMEEFSRGQIIKLMTEDWKGGSQRGG